MNDKERSISVGLVVAFGFIVFGILNLYASATYHKTFITTVSRMPGILFILIGATILIIRTIQKTR